MEIDKIYDKNSGGHYIVMSSSNIEYINPIEFYSNWHIQKSIFLGKELLSLYKIPIINNILDKCLFNKAREEWNEKYEEILKTEIPANLKKILTSEKKNEQIQLLKEMSLNTDQFISFIFYAWNKHGYLFSQYIAEHQHKGVNKDDLPTIISIEEDEVKTVGKTSLTKGEQKQIIENRKVIVSKFFDKGNEWHCFFVTYNSLKGKETWQNGQPHFHYISDKFGISRNDVVIQLKSKNYSLPSLPHINLVDYGHQP